VLSHREPEQVLRLVRVLREGPASEVLVRHDQRRSRLGRADVEAAGGRLLEDATELEWGGWSHVEVVLLGLRELDTEWVNVLSGQDYPLRPLPEIEAFFAGTRHDALLGQAWELDLTRWPAGTEQKEFFLRYAYRHVARPPGLPDLPGFLRPLSYTRAKPPRLGIRRRPPLASVHVSADWLSLSRPAIEALDGFLRRHPRVARYYRWTVLPSESLFATALLRSPALDVGLDHRRFIRFGRPGAPHPDVLTSADLAELGRSDCLFARKFDQTVDAAVLDALDERRRGAAQAR
jgi:hypothetical protein